MTVLKEKPEGGFTVDCTLTKKFTTSAPKSKTELAFIAGKQIVVWRNCGSVWVQ